MTFKLSNVHDYAREMGTEKGRGRLLRLLSFRVAVVVHSCRITRFQTQVMRTNHDWGLTRGKKISPLKYNAEVLFIISRLKNRALLPRNVFDHVSASRLLQSNWTHTYFKQYQTFPE